MVYKGFEGLTLEQIKEKIIIEYYTNGTFNGVKPTGRPIKEHIAYLIQEQYKIGYQASLVYAEDATQLLFEKLWKYPSEKYQYFFLEGEFIVGYFMRYMIKLIQWSTLATPYHGECKSLMSSVMWTSSLDSYNSSLDIDDEDEDFSIAKVLPTHDPSDDMRTVSEKLYDDIYSKLNPNERLLFERMKTVTSASNTASRNLKRIQNDSVINAKNMKPEYKVLVKIMQLGNGRYIEPEVKGKVRDVRSLLIDKANEDCQRLITSGMKETDEFRTLSKILSLYQEDKALYSLFLSLQMSLKNKSKKYSEADFENMTIEANQTQVRRSEIQDELIKLTGKTHTQRRLEVAPKLEKTDETPRIKRPRKFTYQKLFYNYKLVDGKSCLTGIKEVENNIINELNTVDKNSALHVIATKMLALINEDKDLKKHYRKLGINQTEEVVKINAERKVQLRLKLKDLENERKRIILSDVANGKSIREIQE